MSSSNKSENLGAKKPKIAKVETGNKRKGKKPNPGKRPFTIHSMEERERYLNGIIYGEYGVGKTTLAASSVEVPDMRDVLFLNIEAGDMSIDHLNEIDVVNIKTYDQFSHVHKFLRTHCKYRDEDTEQATQQLLKHEHYLKGDTSIEKPSRYHTAVIDSLSEVQKLGMYKLLGINPENHTLNLVPDSPEFKEWNVNTEMIRMLMRLFRDLPMNVLIVCGPRTNQDNKNRVLYKPGLSKALSNEVQGFVDFVGFYVAGKTEEGGQKRRIWLTPGATFDAKNRFRNFDGDFIDNPTMQDFWDIVQEHGVKH